MKLLMALIFIFVIVIKNKVKNAKINDEKCDNKEHLELLINDYQSRVNYLEVIIKKNEDHEKVVFYKQLLKSMAEIKEKEASIKVRIKELKERIDVAEQE